MNVCCPHLRACIRLRHQSNLLLCTQSHNTPLHYTCPAGAYARKAQMLALLKRHVDVNVQNDVSAQHSYTLAPTHTVSLIRLYLHALYSRFIHTLCWFVRVGWQHRAAFSLHYT